MKKHFIFMNLAVCFYTTFVGALAGTMIWNIEHSKLPSALANIYFMVGLFIALLAISFLYSWVPLGRYSSESVRSLNTLGVPKSILWDSVSKTKVRNIFGVSRLCLYTKDSKFAVWVPLNIKHFVNLEKIIENETGNESIIKKWNEAKLSKWLQMTVFRGTLSRG